MIFRNANARNEAGAVLLEVVLSLLLFVAAVAVVSSALNASMNSVERQRLAMHAANLAATVHAEIDLGIRTTESPGPEAFEAPFENWTCEIAQGNLAETESAESNALTRIEVVIRNTNSPNVFRLAQTHKVVKTAIQVQTATNAPASTPEVAP
jgi:hypothetical protein